MTIVRRIALGFLIVAAAVLLLFALNYQSFLRAVGGYLVESQAPVKADAVVVLAGDYTGDRIRRGAELVAAGYAPVALVSGPFSLYGVNEADLAIQFAVRSGAPSQYFQPVYLPAHSTRDEAHAYALEFRKRNVRRVLLVTSNFHTRRAAWTFRRAVGPSVDVRIIAAPNQFFHPDSWWHNREGQKTVFYEYSRTLGAWMGL